MKYEATRNYDIPDGLGNDQSIALDKLYDWYHSDELECTLSGFAGTGKTFVLKAFIRAIVKCPFVVTAPTHKALCVLENATGCKGVTLHSLHGLRLNLDLQTLDIEKPQFDPKGTPKIQYYKLAIIDEASMINKSLFALNRKRAKEYGVKILYVGDSYQLPPVNETISKVFDSVVNIIQLTEIMRQNATNPSLPLFDKIRTDIERGTSTFIKHIVTNKEDVLGSEGYQLISTNDFKDRTISAFQSDKFSKNPNLLRIATYTNKAANQWNTIIRNSIIDSKDILHYNDLIMSYTTLVDDYNIPMITNSVDYLVHDIRHYQSDIGLKTYIVRFKAIDDGRITPPLFVLDHSDAATVTKYLSMLDYLHAKAVKLGGKGWYAYYKLRNKYLTMVNLTLPVANSEIKRSIDYGYAITTHKLQGSTLTNIAIDLTDIVNNNSNDVYRNKMIYVALSRAKQFTMIKY